MNTRKFPCASLCLFVLAAVLTISSVRAQSNVQFYRFGVKQRIVDSLWQVQQSLPSDTSELDAIRSPYEVGFQATTASVQMENSVAKLFMHTVPNSVASGNGAVIVDSIYRGEFYHH